LVPAARDLTRRVDLSLEPEFMESPIDRITSARTYEFSVTSKLAASADKVWNQAATMEGVNRELFPLARMTYPKAISRLDRVSIAPGRRLFRSWILLFGFIPIDYDDITLATIDPEGGFLEISSMFSQLKWQHERLVRSISGGCTVADHVQFTPRLPAFGPLYRAVFHWCFELRHHNLRRRFGRLADDAAEPVED
jgi:hypothetical protein